MPTAGLSLVGFMAPDAAVQYLRSATIPAQDDDAYLMAEWTKANAALGPLIPNAGNPEILSVPPSHAAYVADLCARDWYVRNAANWFAGAQIALVEADPLLAFQFSVDVERSQHHCGGLSTPPTLDELFELCLPRNLPVENFDWAPGPGSLIIRSRSLNLRMLAHGMFPGQDGQVAGVFFGSSAPLAHVVRYNGRCYLLNGFHRVYGARMAGATHVPCVIRDVQTKEEAGIAPPTTFDLPLLESADPPTVGHFAQGRALQVQLRATTRVLHISWAEYGLPNE